MSLSVKILYGAAKNRFAAAGGSSRFDDDFVYAVNMTLDGLSFAADLDSPFPHINDTEGVISALDERHSYLLDAGIDVFLMKQGQKPARGGEDSYVTALRRWEDVRGDLMVMESIERQSERDDDGIPVEDIVGLGYKG